MKKKEDIERRIGRILDEEETFFLSLVLLGHLHEDKQYKDLSELIFLFDNYKGFKQFIKYYGGKTIEVPTLIELKQTLRLLDLFQKVVIDKRDFDEYYTKLKLSNLNMSKDYCRKELDKFTDYLINNGAITLKQIKRLSNRK